MTFDAVTFRPIATLSFNDDEIDILLRCSEAHYDADCRAAGKVGGFLYGIRNLRESHDTIQREQLERGEIQFATDATHDLTFREVDTLAKISQIGSSLFTDERPTKLHFQLRRVLKRLNELATISAAGLSRELLG